MSALADEILAAFESPRGRALLVDVLREALTTRDTNVHVDSTAVAKKLGMSRAALTQLLYRYRKAGTKHELEELQKEIAGKTVWLEAAVDDWIARCGR